MRRSLLFLLLLFSCSEKRELHTDKYFSLSSYFNTEAERFSAAGAALIKTVQRNGIAETIEFNNVNWQKEFAPFIECDINKPAFVNSYKCDSVLKGNFLEIIYKAKENIPVNSVKITLTGDSVTRITINKSKSNVYYEITDEYLYTSKEYKIKGKQKIRFLRESDYIITAQFNSEK